jgi:hypothetical protein
MVVTSFTYLIHPKKVFSSYLMNGLSVKYLRAGHPSPFNVLSGICYKPTLN